jgi:hypothetical protein
MNNIGNTQELIDKNNIEGENASVDKFNIPLANVSKAQIKTVIVKYRTLPLPKDKENEIKAIKTAENIEPMQDAEEETPPSQVGDEEMPDYDEQERPIPAYDDGTNTDRYDSIFAPPTFRPPFIKPEPRIKDE